MDKSEIRRRIDRLHEDLLHLLVIDSRVVDNIFNQVRELRTQLDLDLLDATA